MITYTIGNILDSNDMCLVNTVNTVGVMGKGLALEYKRKYPNMFNVYKKHCVEGSLKIGTLMFYRSVDSDKIICNFPTKIHWRNPSKLSYIESGLRAFTEFYTEWNITSVSFPKLGCGLGGLNWEFEVRPLMEHYLTSLNIPVHIYV